MHLFPRDKGDSNTPVVLLFPAMGVKAPYYFDLANSLNGQNLHFACTDLRGHGPLHDKPNRTSDFGYHEMIHMDWPAAINRLKEIYPNNPIYLMGHSLGGQLSACYSAIDTHEISGLILVASGNVHYQAYRRKWKILFGTQLVWYASRLVGYWPGNKLGFAGNEAQGVIRDWAYNARSGRYRAKDGNKFYLLDGKLSQVETKILAISFDGDKLAPHSAMQSLLDKFHRAKKTHIRTCARELDIASLGHFDWVKNASKLSPKIGNWIEQHSNSDKFVSQKQPNQLQ